jgi:hypothetical protein
MHTPEVGAAQTTPHGILGHAQITHTTRAVFVCRGRADRVPHPRGHTRRCRGRSIRVPPAPAGCSQRVH